mmetsp:Transcript_14010/g.55485  ORF Transcript_14010/g.55485 Transcript_14010/m.55485 type:complete len:247 (-) Transcript_14010:194-934(-)
MYDLSLSHLKLSGSVLTLCTFHGTPFPLFTCPLFQIHRPKLLSPTRPRFINAWDLRCASRSSAEALSSSSRLTSASAWLTSSMPTLTSTRAQTSFMSLFTATSSFVASPSWDISSLSSALFTELASALLRSAASTSSASAFRNISSHSSSMLLSPPSPSLGRSVPGLMDMERGAIAYPSRLTPALSTHSARSASISFTFRSTSSASALRASSLLMSSSCALNAACTSALVALKSSWCPMSEEMCLS